MNKNIIKKIIFIFGIIISFFAVFFDFIYNNDFYFGALQLLLLLFGISLIISYWSQKTFVLLIGLIIGINVVVLNKQYFNLINESPIVKKNLDNIDKRVIELVIDKRFKELKEFFLLSESYIDQNQFQKYFAYKNNFNQVSIKKNEQEYFKQNISLIKQQIEKRFFNTYRDLISQDLEVDIIKKIEYEKYDVIVFKWNAFNGYKAIGNIYLPKNIKKDLPIVFSVPGCGENLWSNHPHETNPQHRLGLMAINQIISVTTVSTCSNSEFTISARYEILSEISGGNLNDAEIALVIWTRFIRIFKEFEFLNIDKDKIGITGYSYGAEIIKKLLLVDKNIKYVSLVGTTLISSENNKKKYFSYPAKRIVDSENENFYNGSGSKKLNRIINQTYQDFKVNNYNLLTNLVTFYHNKVFQIIIGRKDTAVSNSQKAFLKQEIEKINNFNKSLSTVENIELIKNDMDHNFSNENNIEVANFFLKNFNNKEELDLDIKYKKNDKKNLMPVNYFLDLKKLYLNEFEKKTYQQESISLENIKNIFKIKNLKYNKPILLLRKEIVIGNNNITAKLYTQKLKNEIHGYFYEFENTKLDKPNKINILVHSRKDFDLELLLSSMSKNKVTYITMLPGYDILSPKFNTTGNLAKLLMNLDDSPTLAGLAFQSISNLTEFSEEKFKKIPYEFYSFGVESNFITLIYNIVSDNFSNIKFYEYIDFKEFFSEKNEFSIPAIFFFRGLNNIYLEILDFDMDEMNVQIMTSGKLEEYRVYN